MNRKFILSLKRHKTGQEHDRNSAPENKQPDGLSQLSLFVPRTKKPNIFFSILVSSFRIVVILIMVICFASGGVVFGIAQAYMGTTPDLDIQQIEDQSQTSFILDSSGNVITTFSGLENRVWASINEIPSTLQKAFIATEDVRFETHNGVDIKRLVGAFMSNIFGDQYSGASTLTQQLVKNTLLSSERTYKRKIQEAYLAIQLENKYSKSEILEFYLNTIPLGESNYGVKTAAKDYFGKELKDLTLRECAMLAGITQSPYSYDPRINYYIRKKPEVTNSRTETVLKRMLRAGYIDQAQFDGAMKEKVAIVEKSKATQMYDMPYFVEYAISDVITYFLRQRALEDTKENRAKIESELRTKGYKIYTTVDAGMQKTAEDTIYNWKNYPQMRSDEDRIVITKNPDGSITQVVQPQAAAAFVDYHTGELKAIVGGRTQPEKRKQLNRAYQGRVPVGSSIKPLTVYGPAFDMGLSPATVIQDIPVPITNWNTEKGYPGNYEVNKKGGPSTLRNGITNSLNIVAARTLEDDVKVDRAKQYLLDLGVKPDQINADGAGLALGTSGITPVELAAAYGCIANKGMYIEPVAFSKVLDSKGNVILEAKQYQKKKQVFKPSTAWLLVDVMKDVINKGTGTKAQIKGMTVAGKTGTNDSYRGVFFAGMTPYYAGAVWVGSDRYKMLPKGSTGGVVAAPIWQTIMAKVHSDENLADKPIDDDNPASLGLVHATVCSVSGKLATDACKDDPSGRKPVTDWFLQGTVPTEQCDMHLPFDICQDSGKIAGPYCPKDRVKAGSLLVIPVDSIIRLLPSDLLKSIYPGAVFAPEDGDDIASLTPDSQDYHKYYCDVHTSQWQAGQELSKAKSNANTLITQVQSNMAAHAGVLTAEQQGTLNDLIASLQQAVTGSDKDLITSRTSELKNAADLIFAGL